MSAVPIVPIVFCIDAEPDLRQPDPAQPVGWVGWDATQPLLNAWRNRLMAATGRAVPLNWYLRMDPQIERLHGDSAFLAVRDRAFLDRCAGLGDEIGVHNHAHRWDAGAHRWVIDHADAAWIDHVIDLGCTTFRRAFGRRLRSFRFGDGYVSNAVFAGLARRGVRYDLSLEPGARAMTGFIPEEASTGLLPDRSQVPRVPYRPAKRDFARPARVLGHRIWALPVSTAPPPPNTWVGHKFLPLNFAHPPAPTAAMFDWLLAERPAPFAVLCLRGGDLANEKLVAHCHANLAMLLNHPRMREFTFVTPAALIRWYRGRSR